MGPHVVQRHFAGGQFQHHRLTIRPRSTMTTPWPRDNRLSDAERVVMRYLVELVRAGLTTRMAPFAALLLG